MFYCLDKAFVLRGWQNAECMLVKLPENESRPLAPAEFSVLMLCDGETPLDTDCLQEKEKDILQRLIKAGIITTHERPLPIDERQRYVFFPNRFVHSVMWSVTGACNFRCRHCFVDGAVKREHETSTAEALSLIDQMAQCGVMQVEITGGEPLTRPDFQALLDRIQMHGIHLAQIYTNGYLVTEALLDGLLKRGIKPRLCFSFDGTGGWHDWMRGVEGAEEQTLSAMRLAIGKGFDVFASMCLHKGNLSMLPDTVRTLAGMGVRGLNISRITMNPRWEQLHEGYALNDPEYLQAAMDYLPHYFQDGCPMQVILNGAYSLHQDACQVVHSDVPKNADIADRYLCPTARFSPYISAEGRLLPCMPMATCAEQRYFPSILEHGLRKCLTDSFFMAFTSRKVADLFAENETCGACEKRELCGGGCRASALTEGHELMGCDTYRCLIWKDGYVELLQQALQTAMMGE